MSASCRSCDEALLQRVRAEFLEMPGLRLTSAEVQRLCGLDRDTCSAVLDRLVDFKFLVRDANGRYRAFRQHTA
jgi:DNA-binding IclR family transcriptional regulator